MTKIVEFANHDDPVSNLLEIAAKLRSGELVGVTVVTTTRSGVVDMQTLCLPTSVGGSARRA